MLRLPLRSGSRECKAAHARVWRRRLRSGRPGYSTASVAGWRAQTRPCGQNEWLGPNQGSLIEDRAAPCSLSVVVFCVVGGRFIWPGRVRVHMNSAPPPPGPRVVGLFPVLHPHKSPNYGRHGALALRASANDGARRRRSAVVSSRSLLQCGPPTPPSPRSIGGECFVFSSTQVRPRHKSNKAPRPTWSHNRPIRPLTTAPAPRPPRIAQGEAARIGRFGRGRCVCTLRRRGPGVGG